VTAAATLRYVALAVGGFQLLANAVLLARGLGRVPAELAREGASTRISLLLRAAWPYGMLGNLCVSIVLLLVAGGLQRGEPLARQVATAIAVYYVIVGLVLYGFAPGRPSGLLAFCGFGAALIATLWLSR
jgi:hypothetical protein